MGLQSLLREPRRILDDLPRHLGEVGRAGHCEASPKRGVKKGEPKLLQQDISKGKSAATFAKKHFKGPEQIGEKDLKRSLGEASRRLYPLEVGLAWPCIQSCTNH